MGIMTIMRQMIISLLVIMTFGGVYGALAQESTDNTSPPIWDVADTMRTDLFEAQRQLFSARRADDPTYAYQEASSYIDSAIHLYTTTLQPDLRHYAPMSDDVIISALDQASHAIENGDSLGLALARGRLWTALLNASYVATTTALETGEMQTATAWLGLREYRQATRVSLVNNQAQNAIHAFQAGTSDQTTVIDSVNNDLRDTYFFRMRDSLNELEDAIIRDYPTRAAEWVGQIQGYYTILSPHFIETQGNPTGEELTETLNTLERYVLAEDWDASISTLNRVRDLIANYQPVTLTTSEIAERGQLFYIFTDLVYLEYKDGVRDGEITIEVEYQEALTFRDQAQSYFEELRPIIAEDDPEAADRIAVLLADMEAVMQVIGDKNVIEDMVSETKDLIRDTLPFDINSTSAAAFTIIDTLMQDMENAVSQGRYGDAEQTRLQAYAIFDFGPEQRLLAFSPGLAFKIDGLFWHGDSGHEGLARVIAQESSLEDFQVVRAELDASLGEAQVILGAGTEPLTAIINSAIIVFREGLEAVVIIAALSAGMVKSNQRFRKPLFVGAFLALIGTGITWLVADAVISLFRDYGERLEAIISLIAIGVLLLITNWFFHKVYWTGHLAGFHKQKSSILRGDAGKILGLVILGFTSIYREGFETVLFLQALVLDSGIWIVLQGVVLGIIGVAIVGVITFRLQQRLPYMQMMIVTGVLIGGVLLMMVGHTVRVLQVVAWLPITPIDGVQMPYWLGQWGGVYPTWEGILAQIGAGVFVIGSYYLSEYQSRRKRQQAHKHHNQPTPATVEATHP